MRLRWADSPWTVEEHRAGVADRCSVLLAGTYVRLNGQQVSVLSNRPLRARSILGETAVTMEGGPQDLFSVAAFVGSLVRVP